MNHNHNYKLNGEHFHVLNTNEITWPFKFTCDKCKTINISSPSSKYFSHKRTNIPRKAKGEERCGGCEHLRVNFLKETEGEAYLLLTKEQLTFHDFITGFIDDV
jgi:hypothetical protein